MGRAASLLIIPREGGYLARLKVVRPDQYIALVLPLHAHAALAEFFDGFMLPPK